VTGAGIPVKGRDPVVLPEAPAVVPEVPVDPDEEEPDVPLAPAVVPVPPVAVVPVVPPEEVVDPVVDPVVEAVVDAAVVVVVVVVVAAAAAQTNPSGSVELAVKVIWVLQKSVTVPEELAQTTPASNTPPPARTVDNSLSEAIAGPNSKSMGRVVICPVTGAVLNGP
jgi:hypothetical protein